VDDGEEEKCRPRDLPRIALDSGLGFGSALPFAFISCGGPLMCEDRSSAFSTNMGKRRQATPYSKTIGGREIVL
jgi:hypothetical protein